MDRFITRTPRLTICNKNECVEPDNKTLQETNNEIPSGSGLQIQRYNDNSDSDSTNESEEDQPILKKNKMSYKQNFKEDWKNKFGTWLTKSKDNKPCCEACNKLINGGFSHIRRHENTALHINNLKKCERTVQIDKFYENTEVRVLKSKSVKSAELKLTMFLHEHNLPFLLMDHLVKVVQSVCPDSAIAKDLQCGRTKATHLTTDSIASEQLIILSQKLRTNKFSLIIDETTDVGTCKSLAIVARFFDGMVKDRFFGLIRVTSATAESLFNAITEHLKKNDVPLANMIGLAADNAAVMMGHITGVKARFKEILPDLFVLGCTCHSFHLCSSAAAKKLPKSIEEFIRGVYNYFSNSSKRCEELKECQIFVNIKPHKMLKPSQTRWLSLQAVVDRVLESWDALVLFFINECHDNDNNSLRSAQANLTSLQNPLFKIYFSFLSYVLELVNRLNIEFQSEKPKIHVLLKRVKELYKTILRNFVKKVYIDKDKDLEGISPNNPRIFLQLEDVYYGAKTEILISKENISAQDLHNFRLRALDFYIELCQQIKHRFSFNDPILTFVSKFGPEIALSGEVGSIAGDSLKYFGSLVDNVEELNLEWRMLSDVEDLRKFKDLQFQEFWTNIIKQRNSLDEVMFPNLSILIKGLLCLPHSSAAAERVFSQLTLMKTKSRNRLEVDTCDSILHEKELLGNDTCYTWQPSDSLLKRKPKY